MATPTVLVSQPNVDPLTGITYAPSGLSVTGSFTGSSLTAVSQLTASAGVSITASGETITAGGLSITAGGATVTGGLLADKIAGGTAAVQTVAASSAITVGAKVAKITVSAGATVTALSITTSGATGGQELYVINENAAGASTAIISSGVIVASGTTSVTISGLACAKFIFDDTQTLWVKV